MFEQRNAEKFQKSLDGLAHLLSTSC